MIKSFQDLDVYRLAYQTALEILSDVVPRLPREEWRDLTDQLRRASKAIPTLIAEGYASKHQPKQFRKYLEMALAESNEMIVHLSFCRDVYGACIDQGRISRLLDVYDKLGKQVFRLAQAWKPLKVSGELTHLAPPTTKRTSHLSDALLTSGNS